MDTTTAAAHEGDWTIAWRKPRANRFVRADNFTGTWRQAVKMSGIFGEASPGLEVYYIPSKAREDERPGHEDNGNILVPSGKRVRIVEGGVIPAELLPRETIEVIETDAAGVAALVVELNDRRESYNRIRNVEHEIAHLLDVIHRFPQVRELGRQEDTASKLVTKDITEGDNGTWLVVTRTLVWGEPEVEADDVHVVEILRNEDGSPVTWEQFKADQDAAPELPVYTHVACPSPSYLASLRAEHAGQRVEIAPYFTMREVVAGTVQDEHAEPIGPVLHVRVTTPEIRQGDIVLNHGMRILIDGPAHIRHHGCRNQGTDTCPLVYAWPGTVLNVEEAVQEHGMPRFFLYDSERDIHGPGHGRENYWTTQGNDLAHWFVERFAS